MSSASLCASLTIEAALSLTLFMFTVILLSVPMEILDTQRKVQTVLEVTGRELGWQVYRTSHTVHPADFGGVEAPRPTQIFKWGCRAASPLAAVPICGSEKLCGLCL